MGLDLCLMPFPKRMLESGSVIFSHTMLELNRSSVLFTEILKLEETHGKVVLADFYTFRSEQDADEGRETHYGVTTKTPYGELLQYVPASVLRQVSSHRHVRDNYENLAAWEYLRALGDNWMIALYWH